MRIIIFCMMNGFFFNFLLGDVSRYNFHDSTIENTPPPIKNGWYISSDWNANIYSYLTTRNKSEHQYTRGSFAIFAMHRYKNWGIGGGVGLELENYRNTRFNAEEDITTTSIGIAVEYQYGKHPYGSYQFLSRVLYQNIATKANSNIENLPASKASLGWGPTIDFSRIQISPVINLNFMIIPSYDYYQIRTGALINLIIPIHN